jgi:hypothetical protein
MLSVNRNRRDDAPGAYYPGGDIQRAYRRIADKHCAGDGACMVACVVARMIDPAYMLSASDYVRWKLACLSAAQSGLPFPPLPSPHVEGVDVGDGVELRLCEGAQIILEALTAIAATEGVAQVAPPSEAAPTTAPESRGHPLEGGRDG